uniref:Tc1-like transposase DDE domain-containing protein n=1 Tax=Cyprinus carpio carpio TaxID=630221 RepID=A0A9J8DCQ8_CYPCA
MHSILGRESFCRNDCFNAAWHGGNQPVTLLRCYGGPGCFDSGLKLIQSVGSCVSQLSLHNIPQILYGVQVREILEHFMLPSAEKLYGDEDFVFQHDLAPSHSAKTTGKWFTDHGITVLNWPANSPDLNPIENLWDILKRKLRDARPNTLDELKAAIEASWASITPQQCHRLIASMPRRIEAVISAKGFPTKY